MEKGRRRRKRRKQKTGSAVQTDLLLTDNQQKMAELRAAALVVDAMSQRLAVLRSQKELGKLRSQEALVSWA